MEITVLGLGYIGLPTATMLAVHGHRVHGYDVNRDILERLRQGETRVEEPGLRAFVRDAVRSGRLQPTADVHPADAYILCVPTPFDPETKRADLSFVEAAAGKVAPLLKAGDLVILESTVPARTTEDVLVPVLESSGLDCRSDVLVAHCPETVLPGNIVRELVSNSRIVGGITPGAAEAARDLYGCFVKGEIVLTDATTAEFVKLIGNAYRDVNVAFANEVALIGRDLGVDARRAIEVANLHPRVNIHQPGPGVGGHCIPVDPWFLIQASGHARLLRCARDVNDGMPAHVVNHVLDLLEDVHEPRVAVLGLAYKGNVDDTRESPSFRILRHLEDAMPDADVVVNDPHVPPERHPTLSLDDALAEADCLVVATDHDEYRALEPGFVAKRMRNRYVVDARGILDVAAWVERGFTVRCI